MADFRVDLEGFRGPLDLLLFLVRRHELAIEEIAIAEITQQFVEYIELLRELDIGDASDFLEMAATLLEIKSRHVLPQDVEVSTEEDESRQDLVRKLLEYKKFRDAASVLEERSRQWQQRFPRQGVERLQRKDQNLAKQPIAEVELWDLVSAFGRIMREHRVAEQPNIVYDDTPIRVYMGRIQDRLAKEGRIALHSFFKAPMHKSSIVGIILAVLELVRHHAVYVEQREDFGDIWISPGAEETNSLS